MKHGFRLLIHKSLSAEEKVKAVEVFNSWFIKTKGDYSCRRDSHAYMRRNLLGYSPDNTNFTVRRMSTVRRIFAAVPLDKLERVDGLPLEMNQCICAMHKGGQRVRLKQPLVESEYEIFHEEGDIKG